MNNVIDNLENAKKAEKEEKMKQLIKGIRKLGSENQISGLRMLSDSKNVEAIHSSPGVHFTNILRAVFTCAHIPIVEERQ